MRTATLLVTGLLWAASALAMPTPQQSCDSARVRAWKVYTACLYRVVAQDAAEGPNFDEFRAFTRCRHTYFQTWTSFQGKLALVSSTCRPPGGARFVDSHDGTVTDNLTTLVWEKKDTLDDTQNFSDPHDADNTYAWCSGPPLDSCTNSASPPDGTAFTSFLETLNGGAGFAGANGWRIPTLAELQSIMLDFVCVRRAVELGPNCRCGATPCIDATFGPTRPNSYLSATTAIGASNVVWLVGFDNAGVGFGTKPFPSYVRAVRGGL